LEHRLAAIVVAGGIYYVVAVRGRAHDSETQADVAAAEAVIG